MLTTHDQPPAVEEARLAAVRRYDILDSPPDGAFDRIAALAATMFAVPIALVTIVDEARIWFKSLYGLEGPREIPRDPGLCASAIYQDDPYIVTSARSDPRTISNPLVAGLGVQFYAAAPLVNSGGHRLGTLCIIDRKTRRFSQQQAEMLKALAAVVVDEMELRLAALRSINSERMARENATAQSKVKAGLFAREHQIATLLQSAMLPRTLPRIDGLTMSGSYVAASVSGLVGGDWYDAFQTANDRVLITVGDVMGHGLDAAVAMGKVRQALRVLARSGMTPLGIMNSLDAALHDEGVQMSVTAFVGLLDPRTGQLEYSIAGHPPPLMRTSAGNVSELEFGDLPLGIFRSNDRSEHRLKLDISSMLVLYTDGLTESSRNVLEGENRLREVLRSDDIATSQEAAESLRQRLARSCSDDVAILTVTRTPVPPRPRSRFPRADVLSPSQAKTPVQRVSQGGR